MSVIDVDICGFQATHQKHVQTKNVEAPIIIKSGRGYKAKKTCKFCGNEYWCKLSHFDRRSFCSRKCYSNFKKALPIETHPRWKSVNRVQKCIVCNKEYITRPYLIGVKQTCGDKKCISKLQSFQRSGCNNSNYKEKVKCVCVICENLFYVKPSEAKFRKTCSRKCMGEYHRRERSGENSVLWRGGKSFEPYCIKFNAYFRERVRAFFNNKCVECGMSPTNELLNVHHVNFDKSSCCNNSKPLFVTLCRSCHAKTNFNRSFWESKYTELINSKYGGKCYYTDEEYSRIISQ